MKRCRNICDKFKAIIAGMSLGLVAFFVTSCDGQARDVNHVPSVTEYLELGYTPYLAFDEWLMKGSVMLWEWEVANSCDERIVLLKDEDSLVHVVRVGCLSQVLTYYKKDWGWYNRVVITGEDSCVYDRYILKDTIIELQIDAFNDGKVLKNMYVKTRNKCIASTLHDTCTWSGCELPQWHDMKALHSTVYELGRGKKASYYLPSSFWDKPEYYYEYPVADTTIFTRSLGLGDGTLKHCKDNGWLLEFEKDKDGIFNTVEVKPRCKGGQQALAKYIYRHSGPMIRKRIQNGGLCIYLCVSAAGDIVRCKLENDMSEKDKLEKQICRNIPVKFETATIFGHPVSCWYIIYIDPDDVGYHRKDGKEHIFVTRTLKSDFF